MIVPLNTSLLRAVDRLWSGKPVQPHQFDYRSYSDCPSYVVPQLLCNRSFWWRLYVVSWLFLFSDGIGFFVMGSIQISSFFSFKYSSVDIYTQNRHVSSLLVQCSCITRHKSCITRTHIAICRLFSPLTRIFSYKSIRLSRGCRTYIEKMSC